MARTSLSISNTSGATAPSLSPDGTTAAFSLGGTIYTISDAGTNRTAVSTPGTAYADISPQWTPDGKSVYWSGTPLTFDVSQEGTWIATANGNSPHLLWPLARPVFRAPSLSLRILQHIAFIKTLST